MAQREYTVEQEYGDVESNPLMLDEKVTRKVISLLNTHLASLFVLHHQYHKHQWVVEGPQFRELEQLFSMHAEQVEAAAVELGERVNSLGGVPASTMRKQLEESYLEEEPDGILEIREMLYRDVDFERTIATRLRDDIRTVTELGDWGSEDLLKTTLQATEKRASFVQKHLERESLDRGLIGTEPDEATVESTFKRQGK